MNHEFCIQCGHKALFQISKPKFCPSCGEPFNTSSVSLSRKNEDLEDDDDHVPVSFNMEKLRASIVSESAKRKVSLDDLWKDPAPKDSNFYREPSSDPSGKELLKQTMTECAKVKITTEIGV